jgi:uncharacterized protein YkwD
VWYGVWKHQTNKYQNQKMKSISGILLFVLAFTVSGQAVSFAEKAKLAAVAERKLTIEEEILSWINKYRESRSLPALQMNTVISEQAFRHSEEMADKRVAFGHDGFQERVRSIIQKIGTLRASAENVAFGKLSPEEVVSLWIKSPGHRKNIEGNYTMTGIGVAKAGDGSLYFTQIFSRK